MSEAGKYGPVWLRAATGKSHAFTSSDHGGYLRQTSCGMRVQVMSGAVDSTAMCLRCVASEALRVPGKGEER